MMQPSNATERPSVASVAANPKAFVGKRIGFRNASCVDQPKGGFLCLITESGRALRIDAMGLGASGGDIVAERLVGPCKGRDKIGAVVCKFDIEIEPLSAQNEAVMLEFEGERVTRFVVGVIQMRVSKK